MLSNFFSFGAQRSNNGCGERSPPRHTVNIASTSGKSALDTTKCVKTRFFHIKMCKRQISSNWCAMSLSSPRRSRDCHKDGVQVTCVTAKRWIAHPRFAKNSMRGATATVAPPAHVAKISPQVHQIPSLCLLGNTGIRMAMYSSLFINQLHIQMKTLLKNDERYDELTLFPPIWVSACNFDTRCQWTGQRWRRTQ